MGVAAYYRVSVSRDGMRAPELYEREIDRYCNYKQLDLVETYSDIDHSGYRGSRARRRPSLEALISERHSYSAVIIPKLSRFGRSMRDLVEYFDLFDTDGIDLVFLDIGIDTSTSQGKLLRNIMAAFAEFESDVKADYSRAAHDLRVRQGQPCGPGPFGYSRGGDSWQPLEDEARLVREIFSKYASGGTLTGIVRWLNENSIKPRYADRWSKSVVRKMLDNPHYIAELRRGGESFQGNWPPLIDPSLWEGVRARRDSVVNKGVHVSPGLYLLSGLIECGHCGRHLNHRTRQDRYPGSYECRGRHEEGWCAGGYIADHLAERQVVSSFLQRYGGRFVQDRTGAITSSINSVWDGATLDERRRLLKANLERIILHPRPMNNRRGVGLKRGRTLDITWREDELQSEQRSLMRAESAGAIQLATRGNQSKTYYTEWRKHLERIRARSD